MQTLAGIIIGTLCVSCVVAMGKGAGIRSVIRKLEMER